VNTRVYSFFGLLVVLFLSGCGQNPCKVIEEFMEKGDAIVKNSSGSDRQRRISDLLIEYEPKFKNIDKDVVRDAKEYVSLQVDFAALKATYAGVALPPESIKSMVAKEVDAMKSIAKVKTDTLEKCKKKK
jgi:hypothetical protein